MCASRAIVPLALASLLVAGVAASLYGGRVLRQQATDVWLQRGTREAERSTNTALFWLSLYHAQMRGFGAVFHSSSQVTEDELLDALAVIEAAEAAIPLTSLAFVEIHAEGAAAITLSTDLDGPLAPGSDLLAESAVALTLSRALDQYGDVIMGPAFRAASGSQQLPLALGAPNAGADGVLLTLVDLDAYLEGLRALHIPDGLRLRLEEVHRWPDKGRLRRQIAGADAAAAKVAGGVLIAGRSGEAEWEFHWDILPEYSGGPDTGLANVVQYGGLIATALVAVALALLLAQNREINRRVEVRTRQLHERERTFQAVFQQSILLEALLEPDGTVREVNRTALEMVGAETRQIVGQHFWDTPWWRDAGVVDQVRRAVDQAREGQRVAFTTSHMDTEGQAHAVDFSLSPVLDSEGEVMALLALGHDITEIHRREDDLRTARDAAQAANESKSAFLANISHEIRTPMNAILGFTEILAGTVKEPQQREYVDTIQESGKALLSLINDILDLSRVESGTLELHESVVDVGALMEEVRRIYTAEAGKKGLDLRIDVAAGVPPALVMDGGRMRQILLNLMGNAVKFTDQGHVRLSLSAVAMEGSGSADLTVTVRDTGVGIPAEDQERIFGVFAQRAGQSINEYGGAGLGLAVTRSMVEMMGGGISVASQVGVGSTFTVSLPGVQVALATADAAAPDQIDLARLRFSPATVLVADDVETNRALVRGYLDQYGLRLIEAGDGQEAMDQVRTAAVDLVLMDVKMPVLDGFTAARRLKANPRFSSVPIIALTASVMRESEAEIAAVCDDFVRKPVTRVELVRALLPYLKHTVEDDGGDEEPDGEAQEEEALSPEVRARLPELQTRLEERRGRWEELQATQTINEVEDFARELRDLGAEYGFTALQVWADRLLSEASSFDVAAMSADLATYPELVTRTGDAVAEGSD